MNKQVQINKTKSKTIVMFSFYFALINSQVISSFYHNAKAAGSEVRWKIRVIAISFPID